MKNIIRIKNEFNVCEKYMAYDANIPYILFFKHESTIADNIEATANKPYAIKVCNSISDIVSIVTTCGKSCPDLIVVDPQLFLHNKIATNDFVNMLAVMGSFSHCRKKINVVVAVNIDVPLTIDSDLIEQLKSTKIKGIIRYITSFGKGEILSDVERILKGKENWPPLSQRFAEAKNNSRLPLVVAFKETWTEMSPSLIADLLRKSLSIYRHHNCEKWSELSSILVERPSLLLFHQDMILKHGVRPAEFVSMMTTLFKLHDNTEIKLGVIIERNCTAELINELKTTEVMGIVPSVQSFGQDLSLEAAKILLSGNQYWPNDIISGLVGSQKHSNREKKGIYLTERQSQVLTLVCKRGLSNKKIASTLKISESTVKIHVSAILKEYGVRNRTQLALAASSSLKA